MARSHKYIYRERVGRRYRYFYSQSELDKYRGRKEPDDKPSSDKAPPMDGYSVASGWHDPFERGSAPVSIDENGSRIYRRAGGIPGSKHKDGNPHNDYNRMYKRLAGLDNSAKTKRGFKTYRTVQEIKRGTNRVGQYVNKKLHKLYRFIRKVKS